VRHRALMGRYGKKVLLFDGKDDYVEVPVSSVINNTFVGRYWTVEVMLKRTGHKAEGAAMTWSTGYTRAWFETTRDFRLEGSYIYADGTRSPWVSSYYNKVGELVHLVFIRDNLEGRVYKNGELLWSGGLEDKDGHPPQYFYIAHGVEIEWLEGLYFLFRIYNRVLTEDEIRRNKWHALNLRATDVRDGLVLELIPDTLDCEAGVWYDNSGYGNHGTIYGARCIEI